MGGAVGCQTADDPTGQVEKTSRAKMKSAANGVVWTWRGVEVGGGTKSHQQRGRYRCGFQPRYVKQSKKNSEKKTGRAYRGSSGHWSPREGTSRIGGGQEGKHTGGHAIIQGGSDLKRGVGGC